MAVPFKIAELFAWVITEADGSEGVPAFSAGVVGQQLMIPMVGADRERIESLRRHAVALARAKGLPLKLVRFSQLEVLEEQ